ncbi:cytochrome C assembly family protein [Oceanobacillus saliphilus]|uniref:cytochrome C assembly family protein n=1 Tax=Oceanobacillus saliphilus TaxID=2925834 RepID=UPI00201DC532|nr:cytochrome c biogenesis protein CcsA [Oceanobacillus saliphilus]
MIEMKWLYEIILIIYGFSLVGYFIDFIHNNRKANRIAFWLLSMVWIIQTLLFFYEVVVERSFPVSTMVDSLLMYSWVLITFSMVINRLFPVRFIVLFINVFGFFVLLFYIAASAANRFPGEAIQFVHEILIAHITLAIISYGFFTIAFLFSIMYLIQYRFLKKKKGLKWMWKLGDLGVLDSYSFKAVSIGVPLLLIAIIFGFVWAYVSTSVFYWLDLKTIGSMVVLIVYIGYLILRIITGYEGKSLATYNIVAFLLLLINFLLFSSLSNFHF